MDSFGKNEQFDGKKPTAGFCILNALSIQTGLSVDHSIFDRAWSSVPHAFASLYLF